MIADAYWAAGTRIWTVVVAGAVAVAALMENTRFEMADRGMCGPQVLVDLLGSLTARMQAELTTWRQSVEWLGGHSSKIAVLLVVWVELASPVAEGVVAVWFESRARSKAAALIRPLPMTCVRIAMQAAGALGEQLTGCFSYLISAGFGGRLEACPVMYVWKSFSLSMRCTISRMLGAPIASSSAFRGLTTRPLATRSFSLNAALNPSQHCSITVLKVRISSPNFCNCSVRPESHSVMSSWIALTACGRSELKFSCRCIFAAWTFVW